MGHLPEVPKKMPIYYTIRYCNKGYNNNRAPVTCDGRVEVHVNKVPSSLLTSE
jgi:hypothetical protein